MPVSSEFDPEMNINGTFNTCFVANLSSSEYMIEFSFIVLDKSGSRETQWRRGRRNFSAEEQLLPQYFTAIRVTWSGEAMNFCSVPDDKCARVGGCSEFRVWTKLPSVACAR